MVFHNISFLVVNVFCVPNWISYLGLYLLASLIQIGFFVYSNPVSSFSQDHQPDVMFLVKYYAILVLMSILIFACNEKIRKEQYVINTSNSQTKKQMTNAFNTSSSAKVIINKDG